MSPPLPEGALRVDRGAFMAHIYGGCAEESHVFFPEDEGLHASESPPTCQPELFGAPRVG